MLVCLCFFFFVFLFNFYFLLCLFVCLFTCFDESVIFYSQISQWRICDFFCFWFVLYSLCSIFSFGLCFFFVFLFNFYFLLGLFVCLFACFDDSVIFYSQVSQWRSCDFFLFLVCSIFSFGKKKAGLAWAYIV